jgi:uncharacterized coiled-coil protein SlyX
MLRGSLRELLRGPHSIKCVAINTALNTLQCLFFSYFYACRRYLALRRYSEAMSLPARKIQAEIYMAEQAVLEERIEHIQKDVAEIKQDIRRVDGKVDQVAKDLAAVETKLTAAIGSVKAELTATLISLVKWMIGSIIAGMGLVCTIAFGIAKAMQ